MKKAKKLAALFLAMIMALSVMAMTAAAYGPDEHVHSEACCEETIMPRIPAAPYCPKCGNEMVHASGTEDYYTFRCYPCGTRIDIYK